MVEVWGVLRGFVGDGLDFFETEFLCITALAVLELTLCQAGLNLRGPPASASGILGLKVCGHCLASPGDF